MNVFTISKVIDSHSKGKNNLHGTSVYLKEWRVNDSFSIPLKKLKDGTMHST